MSRILVFDENKYLRLLYALELAAEGYEVILAASVREAQERLEATAPDLVVVDLPRRGLNGNLNKAKAFCRSNRVPVILNMQYDAHDESPSLFASNPPVSTANGVSGLKEKIRELLSPSRQYKENGAGVS